MRTERFIYKLLLLNGNNIIEMEEKKMTEEKKLRSFSNFGTGCMVGAMLGIGTSIIVAYNGSASDPQKVYEMDVNGDNRPDIVVQRGSDDDFTIWSRKYVFIVQEDGSYRPLSEVLKERSGALESELEGFKSSIEAKVKDLK